MAADALALRQRGHLTAPRFAPPRITGLGGPALTAPVRGANRSRGGSRRSWLRSSKWFSRGTLHTRSVPRFSLRSAWYWRRRRAGRIDGVHRAFSPGPTATALPGTRRRRRPPHHSGTPPAQTRTLRAWQRKVPRKSQSVTSPATGQRRALEQPVTIRKINSAAYRDWLFRCSSRAEFITRRDDDRYSHASRNSSFGESCSIARANRNSSRSFRRGTSTWCQPR